MTPNEGYASRLRQQADDLQTVCRLLTEQWTYEDLTVQIDHRLRLVIARLNDLSIEMERPR